MNNKGQSLVTFILLLPLLFLLLAIIFDLGMMQITKQKYENEIKSTIKYGLKHAEEENIKDKMINMLETNTKGNKYIEINGPKITVSIQSKQSSIFPNIIKKDYDIDITYTGHKENENLIIEKQDKK